MPKLKETDEQQKDQLTRAYIAKNMELYSLTDEQVAIKLRCVKRSFQNKKKNPDTFTRKELRILCKTLKFTDEEKALII